MSRAQIKFEANERIVIDAIPYHVAEHPALPGIPYVQRGGRGFVIQLIKPDGERMALKYFKVKYRVPALVEVATALRRFAELPGMRAARRTVFTRASHAELTTRYPALEYGMLMPWLPGLTWYDIVTTKTPLGAAEGVRLAQRTATILAELEDRGLAHCDIAGANVMVDRRAGQVELVDIEEMYGPGMPQPVEAPAGQDGYQHRQSRQQGQWRASGDRFGTAILLAEMLAWPISKIRANSADEHFFATSEVQEADSLRFRLLTEVLRDEYGSGVAELMETAWKSDRLDNCPPLSEWRGALNAIKVEGRAELPLPPRATGLATPGPSQPGTGTALPGGAPGNVVTGRRMVTVIPPVPIPPHNSDFSEANPDHTGAAQAEHHPASATPIRGADRLSLEGTRLCRNCGEPNDAREAFCKRCGFYIGTGARRPPVQIPMDRNPGAKGASPAKVPAQAHFGHQVSQPRQVALNRDLQEVVSARRVGSPGKGGLSRVETPRPKDEPVVDANAGSWIIVAVVVAFIMTLLALALISGPR